MSLSGVTYCVEAAEVTPLYDVVVQVVKTEVRGDAAPDGYVVEHCPVGCVEHHLYKQTSSLDNKKPQS